MAAKKTKKASSVKTAKLPQDQQALAAVAGPALGRGGKHLKLLVPHEGRKLILLAVRAQSRPALDAMKLAGADFDAPIYHRLPMSHAASLGHIDAMQALLDLGADPNLGAGESSKGDLSEEPSDRLSWGETALISATFCGQVESAQWLIEHGAQIDKGDARGLTPLHWAASMGHSEMARMLVLRGASLSSADKDGMTPLMKAAYKGWTGPVAALLIEASQQAGVLDAVNNAMENAGHICGLNPTPELMALLCAAGLDARKLDRSGLSSLQRANPDWAPGWHADVEHACMSALLGARQELAASRPKIRL